MTNNEIPEELFDVPINVLGLSESTLEVLKRAGVTNIGECLNYYTYSRNATFSATFGFIEVMETEVRRKLIENGYLSSTGTDEEL